MADRLRTLAASLRFRLALLIALALLPLLVLILLNANEQRSHIIESVQTSALNVTRFAADRQTSYVEATREILFTLSQIPAVSQHNLAVCNGLLADVLKHYPIYTNIYTTDAQGVSQCSAVPLEVGGVNIASADWFHQTLESKSFVVGNYELGRMTGKPVVPIAAVLLDDQGQPSGIVGASLALDWLQEFVKRIELPEGGTLTILDNKGVVLARHPQEDDLVHVNTDFGSTAIFADMVARREGVTRGSGTLGVPRLFGFTHVGNEDSGIYVVVSAPEAVAFADVNIFLARTLAVLALVTLLAVLLGWFGSRLLFVGPLERLIALAQRLGSGQLSTRVAPLQVVEFDALGSSLNEMATALEERQMQLAATNRQLELSNRELIEQIQGRREAERANELKTQFLAMVSHELRTPLASIKGFISTLLADDIVWDAAAQKSFLQTADEETDKLTELVNQLLDLAQLQAGALRIERGEQTVSEIVVAASTQLTTIAAQHQLILEIPPGLPALSVDGRRIAQVIINLVSNAARYSPPGTAICIQALPDLIGVQVRVIDHGPGIAPEFRQHIFEAFRQLERKDGSQSKGAGLGLAICKGIVESHGGRIWVEDSPAGTTIAFTLPSVDVMPLPTQSDTTASRLAGAE